MTSLTTRVLAVALAWLALALYSDSQDASATAEGALCQDCNVVLISLDTVRADHLGTYGYEKETSPNLDRFAKRSIVFENAISQSPWTLPSHGSIMSGLYPGRLGVTHYPALRRLPDGNVVLAEVFKKAGYATGAFTGGGFVSAHYGFDRGFDEYLSGGRRLEHNMREAVDFLGRNKDRKFFMFLHGYNAHRPYFSARIDKRAMGLADDVEVEKIRFCLRNSREYPGEERLAEIIAFYDAAIHQGDRHLAAFFKALRKNELEKNTVVLVTSDHGEEFFEHGNCDHVRFVYRESVHVPYIIYIPGLTPRGRREGGLIPASISVARTLLDVAGIDHNMPGATLLPMIKGKSSGFPIVYSEANSPAGNLGSRGETMAITRFDGKVITYADEGTAEAYDLVDDPDEQTVLPEGHSYYNMRKTLRAWSDGQVALPKPERRRPAPKKPPKQRRRRRVASVTTPPAPGEQQTAGQTDGTPTGQGAAQSQQQLNQSKAEQQERLDENGAAQDDDAGAEGKTAKQGAGAQGKATSQGKAAGERREALSPKQQLQRRALPIRKQRPKPPTPPTEEEPEPIPKELEEQLKSLGYLE